MTVFLTGLAIGLGLITPIGPQNLLVLGHGLTVGLPRALWAVIAAGACDTLLILLGAAGGAGLVRTGSAARLGLLAGGVVFLAYLGARGVTARGARIATIAGSAPAYVGPGRTVRRAVAVSLLNPHAILDTVGVIGAVVAAQPAPARPLLALGAVTASWAWFAFLAGGGHSLRRFLSRRRAVWIERISGLLMLGFAVALAVELARSATG